VLKITIVSVMVVNKVRVEAITVEVKEVSVVTAVS
jgi:hypothetical protein